MALRRLTTLPLAAAFVLAAAACGPRTPAPRPAPSPTGATPTPAAPTPVPTTAIPVTPGSSGRIVAWAPGFSSYLVTSQAAVHVEGDTLGPRDDSVSTRARLTVRVSPASAPNGVVVTVDSFLVSPKRGAPMASALTYPLVFQAQLDPARLRIDFLAEQSMLGVACTGPGATLLALARDLAPALPSPLERGRRWSETTTTQLCRSGVPLTITSRHEWTVEGEVESGGRVLVRLTRESQSTIAGTGTGRRTGASIEGTGRASAEYLLDPTAGRLQAATVQSTTELRVRERPELSPLVTRQEARQDAVLQEAGQQR